MNPDPWLIRLNAVPGLGPLARMRLLEHFASPRAVLEAPARDLAVGLLAGAYPALYLSSFRPVEVLKGKWKAGSGGVWLRKGLVVFQFAVSTLLVIGTAVVYYQVDLTLINLESNAKVWIGQKKIKKFIGRGRYKG